jgi:hypothetical protein
MPERGSTRTRKVELSARSKWVLPRQGKRPHDAPSRVQRAPTTPPETRYSVMGTCVSNGKARLCGAFLEALCRTRTDDPFLTMEVLYQLS